VRSRLSISARIISFTRQVSVWFSSQVQNPFMLWFQEHAACFDFASSSHVWIVAGYRLGLTLELSDQKV
jgi:hypothetical protein